jgi:hypothetical protein
MMRTGRFFENRALKHDNIEIGKSRRWKIPAKPNGANPMFALEEFDSIITVKRGVNMRAWAHQDEPRTGNC